MTSCKKAAELSSQSLDSPLTTKERFSLSFHLRMCFLCRRFCDQMEMLRKSCRLCHRLMVERNEIAADESLSPEAKERIKASLGNLLSAEGGDER